MIENGWEHGYLDLVERILRDGDDRPDRTGTGTCALFGQTLDVDLARGFPMMTVKKLPWASIVSELLWFIEGSGDERRLAEILHGTRDPMKRTIWTANAESTTGSKFKPTFPGDLGRVYGVQWRHWRMYNVVDREPGGLLHCIADEVDQLAEVIDKLRHNPYDRRIIMSAWNVGELDQMALPSCHIMAQFFVTRGRLSCMMMQRSADIFLGVPFNVASYALLTALLAQVCGLEVDRLVMNIGDAHLYHDHLSAAQELLLRRDRVSTSPTLRLNPAITEIDDFRMNDIELTDYDPLPSIQAKMSA